VIDRDCNCAAENSLPHKFYAIQVVPISQGLFEFQLK
jgi:hypothetical protein